MIFRPMPKTPRFSREIVISEKIDGTNASVMIVSLAEATPMHALCYPGGFALFAGSRTRWITPADDNHGFAAWVRDHAEELVGLGVGHHFGEWWGRGINRGYGLAEKRFSLFNTGRWKDYGRFTARRTEGMEDAPACCHVVPVLSQGPFDSRAVDYVLSLVKENGSYAAPGFMDPEGIMIYHTAAGQFFKKTLVDDEAGKQTAPRPKSERPAQDSAKRGRRVADLPFEGPDRRKPK